MSIKVMNLVWCSAPVNGNKLVIMLALSDWAYDDGTGARPYVPQLAKKTRVSDRTIQRLLKELEDEDKLIERVARGGDGRRPNEYAINIKLLAELYQTGVTTCHHKEKNLPADCHRKGDKPGSNGVTNGSGKPSNNNDLQISTLSSTLSNTYPAKANKSKPSYPFSHAHATSADDIVNEYKDHNQNASSKEIAKEKIERARELAKGAITQTPKAKAG